ncbi:hypothetical protein ACFFHM_20565 [Halalkalibacter kiskunsagensis]|uniref:Threonine dehydratase n=1 Tax=Halalkalibacter kiskunsagensis TaxID=1548599 RepID=A0ABV6KIR2_9BACI
MEISIENTESQVPCFVTIDPENGIYALRTFDTSGRSFNSGHELLAWVKKNWEPIQFQNPSQYLELLHAVNEELDDTYE